MLMTYYYKIYYVQYIHKKKIKKVAIYNFVEINESSLYMCAYFLKIQWIVTEHTEVKWIESMKTILGGNI